MVHGLAACLLLSASCLPLREVALPFYFNNPFTFRGRNSARSSCVVAKAAVTRANHASAMVCRGKRTNIRAAFATTPKRTDF